MSESSLKVTGELFIATSAILAAEPAEASTLGRTLRLDLHAVMFIDAAGVRTLTEHAEAWGTERGLEVGAAAPVVQRLLRLVGGMPGIVSGANSCIGADTPRRSANRPAQVS